MKRSLTCLVAMAILIGCAVPPPNRGNFYRAPGGLGNGATSAPAYVPPAADPGPPAAIPDDQSGPALPGANSSRYKRPQRVDRNHVAGYRPTAKTPARPPRYNPPGKGYIELPPPAELE